MFFKDIVTVLTTLNYKISNINICKKVLHTLFFKKLYDLFLLTRFNCLKATEPQRGVSLLFTNKFPEIPGTNLIDLRRMKG